MRGGKTKSLSGVSVWLKATFLFFSHNVVNFMEDCFLLALVVVTRKLCGERVWAAPPCVAFPKRAEGALGSLRPLRGICPRAGVLPSGKVQIPHLGASQAQGAATQTRQGL